MTALRIAVALILAAIVAVALVPLLALLDLAGGGDGLGLCRDGLASCRAAYFEGPEVLAVLAVLLFILLALLRLTLVVRRRLEARRDSVGRSEGLGGG
ncbi:MAG: hypothetical protein FJW79_03270 [Actinobacteria bacterium]|nr:hypothetical protein [Actinomycetota bacterium]